MGLDRRKWGEIVAKLGQAWKKTLSSKSHSIYVVGKYFPKVERAKTVIFNDLFWGDVFYQQIIPLPKQAKPVFFNYLLQ